MVLFDNIEIGRLNINDQRSATTIKYIDDYLPNKGIHIKNSSLGIKTSNPTEELDVSGTIRSHSLKTNLLTVWNPNDTASQDSIVNINVAGPSSGNPFIAMNIYNENNAHWSFGIDNSDNFFKIKSSVDFSGDAKIVLDQDGHLGIGVRNPLSELHLSNNILNRKILLFDLNRNDNQYTGFGTGANGSLRYQVSQSSVDHIFYSGTSSTSSIELMRIKGNGKIGINEDNPTSRMAINTKNVDEFGLSLITNLNMGRGAGILFDNRGSGGRNYGIFSAGGSLNFLDQTTGNIFLDLRHDGMIFRTMMGSAFQIESDRTIIANGHMRTMRNLDTFGDVVHRGSVLFLKDSDSNIDSEITLAHRSDNTNRAKINFVKGMNTHNYNINLDVSGNFSVSQTSIDGQNVSRNPIIIRKEGNVEITQNLNVNGPINTNSRIMEKGNILLPPGTILPYAGTSAPPGFLLCDGSSLNINQFTDLFNVIGHRYLNGLTNISSTFRLPDLRARVPVGASSSNIPGVSTAKTLGTMAGTETHTLTMNQMPYHGHGVHAFRTISKDSYTRTGLKEAVAAGKEYFNAIDNGTQNQIGQIFAEGGNQPHNNMQPYLVINYIIKY